MALNVETTNNMTNGLTHTYNLTVDGLAVTAVLTFNGSHGILLCSWHEACCTRCSWTDRPPEQAYDAEGAVP